MSMLPRITTDVLGVHVDNVSLSELVKRVENFVALSSHHRVMYANVHVLNTAYYDPELRCILNRVDLVYCDGAGVKLGARILGWYLPERMTGADWIYDLCATCQERGFPLYFLSMASLLIRFESPRAGHN